MNSIPTNTTKRTAGGRKAVIIAEKDKQAASIKLEAIKARGRSFKGRTGYIKYLSTGKPLTPQAAMAAMCYECMGYYADGGEDCAVIVCPIYPYNPYGAAKKGGAKDEQ